MAPVLYLAIELDRRHAKHLLSQRIALAAKLATTHLAGGIGIDVQAHSDGIDVSAQVTHTAGVEVYPDQRCTSEYPEPDDAYRTLFLAIDLDETQPLRLLRHRLRVARRLAWAMLDDGCGDKPRSLAWDRDGVIYRAEIAHCPPGKYPAKEAA